VLVEEPGGSGAPTPPELHPPAAAAKLPVRPLLAPWLRVLHTEQGVLLEYGQRTLALRGRTAVRVAPTLLPLLDGTRTVDEIIGYLGEPARPAVERVLAELAARALLRDGPASDAVRPLRATAELVDSLAPALRDARRVEQALATARMAVVGSGTLAVEIVRLLRLSGVGVHAATALEPGLSLTICASSDPGDLRACNARALATGVPWFQVLPFDGRLATIGPLYLPRETACYECFCLRRAANLDLGVPLVRVEEVESRAPAAPAADSAVAGLAALTVLRWLVHRDHFTPGAFSALELAGEVASLTLHFVHRVPRCRSCSTTAGIAPPLPWHKEVRHDR
jgi:bacteriocin biosynthesis cyclodehydratase domain-containing protein